MVTFERFLERDYEPVADEAEHERMDELRKSLQLGLDAGTKMH